MDSNVFSPEWMVKAIFITLFCCPPVGLVAIVYGTKARKLYYRGHSRAAREMSVKANRWLWLTVGCGIVVWLGVIVLLLAG